MGSSGDVDQISKGQPEMVNLSPDSSPPSCQISGNPPLPSLRETPASGGKDNVFIITHTGPLLECPPSRRASSAAPRPRHQVIQYVRWVWVITRVEDWEIIPCLRLFSYEVRGRVWARGSARPKNHGEMGSAGRAPHTKGLGIVPALPPKPGRGQGQLHLALG